MWENCKNAVKFMGSSKNGGSWVNMSHRFTVRAAVHYETVSQTDNQYLNRIC